MDGIKHHITFWRILFVSLAKLDSPAQIFIGNDPQIDFHQVLSVHSWLHLFQSSKYRTLALKYGYSSLLLILMIKFGPRILVPFWRTVEVAILNLSEEKISLRCFVGFNSYGIQFPWFWSYLFDFKRSDTVKFYLQ